MTRTMNAALAGLALAAAAGLAAPAGAQQPRLEQTGDGYSVVYDGAGSGNVAGGGRDVRVVGGGGGAEVLYTGPDPVREGRSATLWGGGDDAVITYTAPAAATATASHPAAPRG